MSKAPGTLLLTRKDVARLLSLQECVSAVENAFRVHAEGKILPPKIVGFHLRHGAFHIKPVCYTFREPILPQKLMAIFQTP